MLQKITEREPAHYWGKYDGAWPVYTANVSAIRGYDLNASGEFYLNFREKLLRAELNMTEGMNHSTSFRFSRVRFGMAGHVLNCRKIFVRHHFIAK